MTITTKENAAGKISAYYVDGVKVRKCEINLLIGEHRNEIIEVDYYTGQEFKSLTRCPFRNLKVVFTGDTYGETLMTEAAAQELGMKIVKRWSGAYYGLDVCQVEMPTEADVEDYAITPEAQEVAIETEINAANTNTVENIIGNELKALETRCDAIDEKRLKLQFAVNCCVYFYLNNLKEELFDKHIDPLRTEAYKLQPEIVRVYEKFTKVAQYADYDKFMPSFEYCRDVAIYGASHQAEEIVDTIFNGIITDFGDKVLARELTLIVDEFGIDRKLLTQSNDCNFNPDVFDNCDAITTNNKPAKNNSKTELANDKTEIDIPEYPRCEEIADTINEIVDDITDVDLMILTAKAKGNFAEVERLKKYNAVREVEIENLECELGLQGATSPQDVKNLMTRLKSTELNSSQSSKIESAEEADCKDRFNRGEKIAVELTKKLRVFDSTVEVAFGINEDDEDVFYLSFGKYQRAPFTLNGIEISFHAWRNEDNNAVVEKLKKAVELRNGMVEDLTKEITLTSLYVNRLKEEIATTSDVTYRSECKRILKEQISCGLRLINQRAKLLKHRDFLQAKLDALQKNKHRDSLVRAMQIALENVQKFCRDKNLTAAQNELKLYNICSNAMRELREAVTK